MADAPETELSSREPSAAAADPRLHRARVVQIVLGCIWVLDGALQLQPRMFGQGLVNQMILPMAHGQPVPVLWSITQLAHFIRPDAGIWNLLFGLIQLGIGVGMLFRKTVKPAIIAMAVWAFGVWWFGEGFGMLLTGAASPLTGAPGPVLLYPLIGLLVWPTDSERSDVAPGIPSSAAASGPLGSGAAMIAWSGFWALSAVLWLLPANRAGGSINSTLVSMSSGEPSWYAHVETSMANALPHSGSVLPWLLAMVSLVIAAGPLLSRRPTPFLAMGVALQCLFWVTGMALGGIMTGMGTDPNAAPLVALLAFAMVPTLHAIPARSPARELAARHPVGGAAAAGAALAVLVLSSTYPIATAAASASPSSRASTQAMGGMSMTGSSSSSSAAAPSSRLAHARHSKMTMPGMNGQPDTNWHYSGPPLPAQEQSVLTTVFKETEHGHAMQTPNCAASPTGAQVDAAMQLVQTTSSAVSKFKDLNVAKADGYVPITDTRYPVVHYLNFSYMRGQDVLDPNHVQSLVYAFTPYGPVLVAAMYLMPSISDKGPMPGGCLTQWHAHTNLCTGGPTGAISGFSTGGVCPAGESPLMTPEMLHVWQVGVPGGPLTMDPTDQQVVEAAIMAQQDGQAPVTPGAQVPAITGSFGT
jgi:hypothetical protein